MSIWVDNIGMAAARVMHLACSYWGFVLMSVHLGLHWGTIIGMFRRFSSSKKAVAPTWIFRLIAAMIAGYEAVCFYRADILSYMFLQVDFVFLDYEKSAIAVLC